MVFQILLKFSRIVSTGIGTQVDHIGIHRQTVDFNRSNGITRHTERHLRIITIRSLKLKMHEYFSTVVQCFDKNICLMHFNGRLLGGNNLQHSDICCSESEAEVYKILRVCFDLFLRGSIKTCHLIPFSVWYIFYKL